MGLLHWDTERVRIKSTTHSSRGKSSSIKVELETSDPWALASILDAIATCKAEEDTLERQRKEATRTAARQGTPRKAERRLALPAPILLLPSPEGGR